MEYKNIKKGSAKVLFLLMIIIFGGGIFYILNSQGFEKNPPKIEAPDIFYWNLKDSLDVKISDDSGIVNYKVVLKNAQGESLLESETYKEAKEEILLNIKAPRGGLNINDESYQIVIEATDSSKWNMLKGNSAKKSIDIVLDNRRPTLEVIANSYKIIKGGVALVVFRAEDDHLKSVVVENADMEIEPFIFYEDGYYISLVTWPVTHSDIGVRIVATDRANNISIANVNYFKQNKKYRDSTIALSDGFIDGKISSLMEEIGAYDYLDLPRVDKFRFINEGIRDANVKSVIEATTKIEREVVRDDFFIEPFYPLKNGAVVAGFGDYRTFTYSGEKVSNSYHMGLDLASTQNADIVTSNDGEVIYADFNGIYGNTVIVHHGLGMSSLYSHCSSMSVQKGQKVAKGQVIGKSGVTGLALGDHLHFGVVINGVEVRPEEWMDSKWMDESIYSVVRSAKRVIDSRSGN